MNRTLLLGALEAEIGAFAGAMEDAEEVDWRGYRFLEGSLRDRPVVVARVGVGKSLSAMLTQHLVDRYAPGRIILTGVAGALAPDLEIGDTIVARTCMQYDMDATALGFPPGKIPYSPYRVIPCDAALVAGALEVRPRSGTVRAGHVLTGDTFMAAGEHERARYLREELGGDAVEMEGASVGLVATFNEIPFVIIRTISDKVKHGPKVSFSSFVKGASRNALDFALHLLT
ncbi:MAG: 5'-methylthioadenosine/adenosylhomocysteine nucleosidase [Spirochaetaceae bacterium]